MNRKTFTLPPGLAARALAAQRQIEAQTALRDALISAFLEMQGLDGDMAVSLQGDQLVVDLPPSGDA
jgi:hypothetical protein